MIKKIESQTAPQAIGPYSQAVRAGDYIFLSGQIPINPTKNIIVSGGLKEQTMQVLVNIQAVLTAAGLTFENVVKTEVFLTDLSHFGEMNDVYSTFFESDVKPARTTVQVAALPKGSLIEIACIAYAGS
jgi:2-iminobutanoate/2-iminopropanoate deaminase